MSIQNCRRCGKETEEGELYCPECQQIPGARKSKRLWLFSILFSAALLSLTGVLLWHGGLNHLSFFPGSWWGKPAAVINGESIPREDFQSRIATIKSAVERQYGKNTFAGERGQELLRSLTQEVLDGMLEERLVAQEARRLKIEIGKEQVEEEVQRVSKEIFGGWEDLQTRLHEDGISPNDLKKHIFNLLLLNALKEAKTPVGADPEVSFNAWLIQAKQKAEVVINETETKWNRAALSGGSCCAIGGPSEGPAAPSGRGSQLDVKTENQAKKAATDAFLKINPADKEVTAKVTNYGCHIQVDIEKNGKVVKSYSYQGGEVFEIS